MGSIRRRAIATLVIAVVLYPMSLVAIRPNKVSAGDPPTTTSVSSSLNPSLAGESVTFTATATDATAGTPVRGGWVTFKDGATVLGTGPIDVDASGQARFTTATLTQGSHTIGAE